MVSLGRTYSNMDSLVLTMTVSVSLGLDLLGFTWFYVESCPERKKECLLGPEGKGKGPDVEFSPIFYLATSRGACTNEAR